MLTGKQRAALRKLANPIKAIFQIGKDGLSENLINQLDDALRARELIKITVLETVMEDPYDLCDQLAQLLRAEPVQCVGRKIVLFRRNYDEPKIDIKL
ncbi:MAG: ribosome assembly RNA-binding protein YhbY [Clostridiales bacterium]|nr:ribosome assembly RNA-binding protein YhbY [Clostridiales bacterium]